MYFMDCLPSSSEPAGFDSYMTALLEYLDLDWCKNGAKAEVLP